LPGSHSSNGRRDDPHEVGVGLQQALRLLERRLVVVVAVGDLDELHLRVLRLGQLSPATPATGPDEPVMRVSSGEGNAVADV
jgi:hypothetical protein